MMGKRTFVANKYFWDCMKDTVQECVECNQLFNYENRIDENYEFKRVGKWYRDSTICPYCGRKQHVNVHVVDDEN